MTISTFLPSITKADSTSIGTVTVFTKFITWCDRQEQKRLMWQGITLSVHGCILTPMAMMAALLAGVHPALYIPVIIAIAITFISNLAALPTKFTLPVFFFSMLIDLGVVIAAIITGMDFSRLF